MTIPDTDVEVLTGPERRRRWSVEQKLAIVAEMMQPGASAARVARRYALSTGLLYTWRRLATLGELSLPSAAVAPPAFMPVCVVAPAGKARAPTGPRSAAKGGAMVIELAGGRRLQVDRHVDAEALRRVLSVLEGR